MPVETARALAEPEPRTGADAGGAVAPVAGVTPPARSGGGRSPEAVRREAGQALELVNGDPRRALSLAEGVLALPGVPPATRAVAERAAALSELELGRVAAARRRLERAKSASLRSGLRAETAELQLGLAIALLQAEQPGAALSELASAAALADDEGVTAAIVSQRVHVLMRLGRYDEALSESSDALGLCRASGQLDPVSRLLSNRGVVHAYLGDFDVAEAELSEALTILRRLGYELNAAQVVHNLGFVAARRGDVPRALRHYDEALASYEELGVPAHTLSIDRCELLVSARLLPEARLAAEESVAGLAAAGLAADLAEARLMLAEVALASGDHLTARLEADAATATFERQQRHGWAALARFAARRARWAEGVAPEVIVSEATELAEQLESAGWALQGLEARIVAGRAALQLGLSDVARSVLSGAPARRSPPAADERARAWYALALLRLANGEGRGARRALAAGLNVADQHRAAFGATELRVRTATNSADLAALGLRLAFASRRPSSVLVWAERSRARALWRPEVVPSRDPELAGRLSELRHTVASLEERRLAGEATADLEARRRHLEGEIRHQSLRDESAPARRSPVPTVPALQEELGDRILVELVEHDGTLHGVLLSRGTCLLRSLGPASEVERQLAALHFALSRLAIRRSGRATLETASEVLIRAARKADSLLIGPFMKEIRDADDRAGRRAEIVVVPTGELHAMPWALLPSLAHRAVAVAPSAALWLANARRQTEDGRGAPSQRTGTSVLVAGPGVSSASDELARVGRSYEQPVVLEGAGATAAAVTQALTGAEVAHIAAHGRFRADNAQFSALEVADGPLTVYELERIESPPRLVVLSACDGGRAQVHPGNELMGTTAAMLAMGTRAIVASVAPVPDAGAPPLMAALHRHLRLAGLPPAAALDRSQADAGVHELDPGELAAGSAEGLRALAASTFVCFGAG